MQLTQLSAHLCKQCKWRHLVAKFASHTSGALCQICKSYKWCPLVVKFATHTSVAMLLPNQVQAMESISGSVVSLAMFVMDVAKISIYIL